MKFYGAGALLYPGTKRVIHDFEDGPFSTVNPEIIRHALAMGFTTEAPAAPIPPPEPVIEPVAEVKVEAEKPRRGRPPKVVVDADEKPGAEKAPVGDRPEASQEVRGGNPKGQKTAQEKEGGE